MFEYNKFAKFKKLELKRGEFMARFSKYVNSDKLKETRSDKKLSCRDMARLMGVKSQVTYFNIENGIVEPKITQMIAISSILKGSVGKFFNLKVQEIETEEAS